MIIRISQYSTFWIASCRTDIYEARDPYTGLLRIYSGITSSAQPTRQEAVSEVRRRLLEIGFDISGVTEQDNPPSSKERCKKRRKRAAV